MKSKTCRSEEALLGGHGTQKVQAPAFPCSCADSSSVLQFGTQRDPAAENSNAPRLVRVHRAASVARSWRFYGNKPQSCNFFCSLLGHRCCVGPREDPGALHDEPRAGDLAAPLVPPQFPAASCSQELAEGQGLCGDGARCSCGDLPGAEALTTARAGGPGATTAVLRDGSAWQDFTTGSCTPVNN